MVNGEGFGCREGALNVWRDPGRDRSFKAACKAAKWIGGGCPACAP
jgi:hypothetical protein